MSCKNVIAFIKLCSPSGKNEDGIVFEQSIMVDLR